MKQIYYSEEVNTILNEYLNYLFLLNLSLDNVVYVLDLKMNLPETSKVIHEHVAHLYPEIGDTLSDFMIKSNILPQRTSLNYKEVTFENASEAFDYIVKLEKENRQKIIKIIDAMEYSTDTKQIQLFFEDLLMVSVTRLHNYEEWATKVKHFVDDGKEYRIDDKIHGITGL